ncbi:MAG: 3-hydroxyacyl-CoA dehydrogenase NAD-binding domain-containing protein [Acidobacteriota bacterium]
MGSGIAQVFAQSGFAVGLQDATPEALVRARDTITRSLSRLIEKGALSTAGRDQAIARLSVGTDLDVVSRADLVVEAITEDADAKRRVFSVIDRLAPSHACLASNTSSISITLLASATGRPDRVVGLHFMNPVPLMALVEVVRGRETSTATMAKAHAICQALGKTAVESADAPGFIANRVLMPMINEAAFTLVEGVGSAEAIDTVMRLGMRHPMGPLALADLIGLDVCVAILDVMRDGLQDDKYEACPLLRRLVAEGRLGRKTGRGFYEYAG